MKELDPSKITITNLPDGAENVHGTSAHNGVLWCGTRQIPAQVICFDAATLDVIDAITMPTDGIEDGSAFYPGMEQLIVHKARSKPQICLEGIKHGCAGNMCKNMSARRIDVCWDRP